MTKNFFFLLTLLVSVALFQTACETDVCADKDCGFGLCLEDGACDCDPGYEYDANGSCTVLTTAKFTGEFRVVDDSLCSSDATPYIVVVTAPTTDTLNFANMYASGGNVKGTFVGSEITIARQLLGVDFEISGSGATQTNGDILMNYYLYDIGSPTAFGVCENALFVKQ